MGLTRERRAQRIAMKEMNMNLNTAHRLIAAAAAAVPGRIDPAKSFALFEEHGLNFLKNHLHAAVSELTEDDELAIAQLEGTRTDARDRFVALRLGEYQARARPESVDPPAATASAGDRPAGPPGA